MRPRQIYASTVTRRDRRWARRRARPPLAFALLGAVTLVAALTVLAALVPGLS
ncbi:MAG TPA: hypothetical protein VG474_11750 [Solirubrobacteraceae bacterium]|nr:hypothetical protein [Solirubrobacteraceae bacterium]